MLEQIHKQLLLAAWACADIRPRLRNARPEVRTAWMGVERQARRLADDTATQPELHFRLIRLCNEIRAMIALSDAEYCFALRFLDSFIVTWAFTNDLVREDGSIKPV